MSDSITFRLEQKWKTPLKQYCEECQGDSMSLFIRRLVIDEMKRRGIEPIDVADET
jgi:hypothetical protein